jgi:hypothetical protein
MISYDFHGIGRATYCSSEQVQFINISYFALVNKLEDIEAVELGEVRVKAPTNLVYSVSAPSSQMRSCRSNRRLLIDLGKTDPRLV